jgi:ADP-ribose pyrophosphatase YjhB (NUDIX family)
MSSWPIRVGAVVLNPYTDRVLMQIRNGMWSCFGDDREKDEKPPQAIKRAIKKRLKISVHNYQLVGFGAFETTKGRVSAQYILLYDEEFDPRLVDDLKLRWFAFDDAMSLKPPHIQLHTHSLLEAVGNRVSLEKRREYREILKRHRRTD